MVTWDARARQVTRGERQVNLGNIEERNVCAQNDRNWVQTTRTISAIVQTLYANKVLKIPLKTCSVGARIVAPCPVLTVMMV